MKTRSKINHQQKIRHPCFLTSVMISPDIQKARLQICIRQKSYQHLALWYWNQYQNYINIQHYGIGISIKIILTFSITVLESVSKSNQHLALRYWNQYQNHINIQHYGIGISIKIILTSSITVLESVSKSYQHLALRYWNQYQNNINIQHYGIGISIKIIITRVKDKSYYPVSFI